MKENKSMTQEIRKISILYAKTSKEFYPQIKISEKFNEQKVFYKKTVLKNFTIFTENTYVGVSFSLKMQAFRPATLSKRDSNRGVFL